MKKLVLSLALALAIPASALDLYPAHEVQKVAAASVDLWRTVEPMYVALGTTTYANAGRTAIHTFNTSGGTVPTTASDGLSLDGLSGVVVSLNTSSSATAGGTLQAYVYVPEQAVWMRVADLDLTTVAATNQSWAGIWIPVSRGRVMWVPNAIGTVSGVVYMTGQVKQ